MPGEENLGAWRTFWAMSPGAFVLVAVLLLTLQVALVLSPLKGLQLRRLRRQERRFQRELDGVRSGHELGQLAQAHPAAPGARVLLRLLRVGAERLASYEDLMGCARRALADERELCERFMPTLGSIAATAPLLGLFGTVWGIIEAFLTLALEESSRLSVIAPAMSGALLTTALGLLAAMPASLAQRYVEASIDRLLDTVEAVAESWAGRIAAGNGGGSPRADTGPRAGRDRAGVAWEAG